MESKNKGVILLIVIIAFIVLVSMCTLKDDLDSSNTYYQQNSYTYSNEQSTIDTRMFNILVSDENKDLESIITDYANKKGYKVNIDYAGTLEIMQKLNANQAYDAIWSANSIWTYMIDSKVATLSNSKATYLSPIVFGIKKSKAQELGFIGKQVTTEDIINAVSSGKLQFAMSNPATTNSGASAYLGMLYTIAGNPEVLTEEILKDPVVKSKLKSFFSGLERTSGTEDFLEKLFLNGDYEAVYSYESSIISINQKLEKQGREPLYVVYPFDGVPFSDNPFVYVDHKDDKKAETFLDIQNYLLSQECKNLMLQKGRRTWYGGINNSVDKNLFNPNWGIKTNQYITPVKYPTSDVIKLALNIYQTQYRKPVHVVFCLDFSGSMIGSGYNDLKAAMNYILSEEAEKEYIQFASDDAIDVVLFASNVQGVVSTNDGTEVSQILKKIEDSSPYGGTAIYAAANKALDLLKDEDKDVRNKSIILMTDGEGNIGKYKDLSKHYSQIGENIPIYSIMFGDANPKQLEEIAKLTNGKVFDGKQDLVKAFKEVRGYN